jgi:hypothetical protein
VRTLAAHIWGLLHRRAFGAAIAAVIGGHATAIGMRAFFIVRHKLALISNRISVRHMPQS